MKPLTAALIALIMLALPASACDQDGDREACPVDTSTVSAGGYYDADLDDGRDIPDTPELTEPVLDNGRGEYADRDR